MNRQSVDSKNIASVGWEDGKLEVEFRHGGVYVYEGVPESDYKDLISAPSVGSHFHRRIKPHYSGSRQ